MLKRNFALKMTKERVIIQKNYIGMESCMKEKSRKKWVLLLSALFIATCAFIGTKQAIAAIRQLQSIEGIYMGQNVEVGGKINLKDIYLTAEYKIIDTYGDYTDYEEVKSGFSINPSVITKSGQNEIVVSYQNKTTIVYVEGKTIDYITADYKGTELYVGSKIPTSKLEVYAYFNDGTYKRVKDFTLSTTVVPKEGLNIVRVSYGGKTTEAYVYGKAPLAVQEVVAYYTGDSIIAGNSIDKTKMEVTVMYNDGTMKQVSNFNLSPSVITEEGMNEITVTYGDVSTIVEIYGLERYIVSMNAVYVGPGVEVGEVVEKNDIEVKVTYNDESTEFIDDFSLYADTIWMEGENPVVVYCDEFMTEVTVYGVKGFSSDFSSSISKSFFGDGISTEVTLAVSWGLDEDKFQLLETDMELMERIVKRAIPTKNFLAFQLAYDDDEMVLEFPMGMKVTVPEGYVPKQFAVYYKPNNSTIVAKLDGRFMDEEMTEYQVVVYEPGVYILVNEIRSNLVTEIVVEEEELTMKPNRSYSLRPLVLPVNAENREITYWSSDEDVATVSESGKIRTLEEGSCEIWIETTDDSGVYKVIYLEVTESKK